MIKRTSRGWKSPLRTRGFETIVSDCPSYEAALLAYAAWCTGLRTMMVDGDCERLVVKET